MRISPADLLNEYRRSVASWPFIADVEATYRLPRCLLVAVGSRETNMTNEVGDGGHGYGVWQYDDRSHTIPAGFDADVHQQATVAASMLRGLIDYFAGNVKAACCAYNAGAAAVRSALSAGRDPDSVTTGRDYGSDVLARMAYLQGATAAPPPPAPPVDVPAVTFEETAVQGKFVQVTTSKPGEANAGDGWEHWDTGQPVKLCWVSKQGPYPPADGYWPDQTPVDISCQPRGNEVIVTVRNATPGATIGVWAFAVPA